MMRLFLFCGVELVNLFFFSSRRRHTRCALVTGVQTCALPIYIKLEAPAILAPFFQGAEGFTGSPKWSYQAAIDYDLPIGPSLGKVTLHADHYYIGKYFKGPVLLPSYRLTNFHARWSDVGGQPIDVTFYLDNAFNKRYIQNVILSTPSFGVYTGSFGPPRTYGVSVRYRFGS